MGRPLAVLLMTENNQQKFDPKEAITNNMSTMLHGDSAKDLAERAQGLAEDAERNVEWNVPEEFRADLTYIISIRWIYRPND